MKIPKHEGPALFALMVALLSFMHVAQADSRLAADVQAVQADIQAAQGAFVRVRKSKGQDTAPFDAAIKRLRARVNTLNISLGSAQQAGATGSDLEVAARRLNAYLGSLEKARDGSDWRSVERDLGRLDAAAGELHTAALDVPETPRRVTRTLPGLPTTGPGAGSVPAAPGPATGTVPRAVVPYKPPLVVTPGPGPKGPDDQSSAAAPPPVKIQEGMRRPEPVTLRSGTKIYFASVQPRRSDRSTAGMQDTQSRRESSALSRAQISEAISHVRQAYNIVPKSSGGSPAEPYIVMSPVLTRGIRGGAPSDYDFYDLENGSHHPWSGQSRSRNDAVIVERGADRLKCDEAGSLIAFTVKNLGDEKYYMADITVTTAGQWEVNGQVMQNTNNHLLYAFTKSMLPWYELLELRCLGSSTGYFKKIEIYEVN